jgi:hypothetical protein
MSSRHKHIATGYSSDCWRTVPFRPEPKQGLN